MGKRFIDISIHNKAWRKLSCKLKLAWYYLWNNCDASGVWEIDEDLFEFDNGFEFNSDEILNTFSHSIEVFEGKLLLKDFIFVNQCEFSKLNENYNPHKPVFRSINKHKLKLNPSLNQASFKLVVGVEVGVVEEVNFEKVVGKTFKPTLEEFLEYAKENTGIAYPRLEPALKLKYSAWLANDWKTGGKNPRKIKNWKTTLLNTIPHLKATPEGKGVNPKSATMQKVKNYD